MQGKKIGLLGGSFNPAHEGHLHISLEALKRLDLDEVWWLVSPKNPLKKASDLAPYKKRFEGAQKLARHPRIHVLDIEEKLGFYYSIDTLRYLTQYRDGQFVWLMGADNLEHFHRWRSWRAIAKLVPIAVLDRAPYALKALHAPFAATFARHRLVGRAASRIASLSAPAWTYVLIPRSPLSSTSIRKTAGQRG